MIGPDRKPIGYHCRNDCPGCSNNAQDLTYFSGDFEKKSHIRDQHILFYRSRNTTNILKIKDKNVFEIAGGGGIPQRQKVVFSELKNKGGENINIC
jgi:hypothetical protein